VREQRDIIRQITVAASAVIAIIGSFVGSGAAGGTPIQDAAGGALAANATLIAPATPAFSIWAVIYLGLMAYAVWQFLPSQSGAERQRRLGYWVAASLILNAAWILSIQYDLLGLSVPIIVILLAVLLRIFIELSSSAPSGRLDALLTDGSLGLYLGWVAIATAANVTALLVAVGFTGFGIAPEIWALVVIAVAALAGLALAVYGHGRIAPALSLSWGLAWVAVGRLAGEPASTITGIAAIVAVVVVLGSAIVVRARPGLSVTA
jgi:hypothetical protein